MTAAVAARLLNGGDPVHAQSRIFAADADTTVGGTIDTCRSVTLNDAFQIDLVFKGAQPMFGPESDLNYDGSILRIDSVDASTTTSLFLTKNGSTNVFNLSDSTPDSDGTFHTAAFDIDLTGPSGDGAVIRLNVTAIGSGTSALTIASPLLLDVAGGDVTGAFAFQNGEIRVGTACPAPPPAVGGVTEFLIDGADPSAESSDGSGLSAGRYAAIAFGSTGAAIALAASAWYARRRWLGNPGPRSGRSR